MNRKLVLYSNATIGTTYARSVQPSRSSRCYQLFIETDVKTPDPLDPILSSKIPFKQNATLSGFNLGTVKQDIT